MILQTTQTLVLAQRRAKVPLVICRTVVHARGDPENQSDPNQRTNHSSVTSHPPRLTPLITSGEYEARASSRRSLLPIRKVRAEPAGRDDVESENWRCKTILGGDRMLVDDVGLDADSVRSIYLSTRLILSATVVCVVEAEGGSP